MIWKIEFDPAVRRDLKKLDKQSVKRVLLFLSERVAKLNDPRSIGEALKGSELGAFWKYRVGNFRIIANIDDRKIRILVLRVGDRKNVYRD